MIRKLLMLSSALVTFPAQAQTFPKPSDVPTYFPTTPSYAAGTTLNVLGDNSNVQGGTPMAYSYELNDIPSTASGWVVSGADFEFPATQAKFRTIISSMKIAGDDPIRNWSQPGTSHCHEFFGNVSVNAYSTHTSLRNQANTASSLSKSGSTAAGGPYNATGYWEPCEIITNPFGDGKNYSVKADYGIFYYLVDNPTDVQYFQRLPLGLRFILGTNMDDPDDVHGADYVNIANAQSGTAGRYVYHPRTDHWRWNCISNGHTSNWLKNTDGSDALTCPAGQISVQFDAPTCWDGINLWSPGGYKHLAYSVHDNVTGKEACPNHWYMIPGLQGQIVFTENGFSDYGRWRLSSDDMAGMTAGRTFRNGESFHADWMDGWDELTRSKWEIQCIGLRYVGGAGSPVSTQTGTTRECDSSAVNTAQHLIGGYVGEAAPDGSRNPQVPQTSNSTAVRSQMYFVPASANGPKTMNTMGH